MKGIICAGGLGTRLRPLTYITNKHLLPVYDRPMIFYPIQTLVQSGIRDIVIVSGGPHAGHFIPAIRDGKDFGIDHVYFAYQEKEGGIADAIACAAPFAEGEKVAVILGDNCTDADISKEVAAFEDGALVFLKPVPDPERFGVPVFNDQKRITIIEEKPREPKSDLAVTGLYLYDETVFGRIRTLKPSVRNELEVTDLNNSYSRDGKLCWAMLDGYWRDAGTIETLFEVSSHWQEIRTGGPERK